MKKIYVLLLLTVGLFLVGDLLHPGFPLTHDGDVHLLRLTNFYEVLKEGIVIPRWAGFVNWGYGQPVFEFFYPLPSYLASALHVGGISLSDSLKIVLASSLVMSGITMFLWLVEVTTPVGAFTGALLYMVAPYRLVDIYVRGDVGESLGLVFVPLVLLFLVKLAKEGNNKWLIGGSLAMALLILSHNIVSLMAFPLIVVYAAYLYWTEAKKSSTYWVRAVCVVIFGLGLSAFFWIPGLLEGKYTLRDIVTRGGYLKNFASMSMLLYSPWSYGGSGQFTQQLGIPQWILFSGSLLAFPYIFRKKRMVFLFAFFILSTIISIFLMLPASTTIWSHIILLQNFQFPWRFLLATTFTTAVMGGLLIGMLPKKIGDFCVLGIGVCILIFQNHYWYARGFVLRPDTYFSGVINQPSDTGESSPIWSVRFMEHGFIYPLQVVDGNAAVTVMQHTSVLHRYQVKATDTTTLLENTLYFPGWHVVVDGKEIVPEFQNPAYRGLMIFPVAAGKHEIVIRFSETRFRLFADYISAVSLILLFTGIGIQYLYSKRKKNYEKI